MPVIKARAQKQTVRHIGRLFHDNYETLWAYATFIDEDPDYVVNQLIETVLGRDRDFQAWRRDHPGSHVQEVRRPRARTLPRATAADTGARLSVSQRAEM